MLPFRGDTVLNPFMGSGTTSLVAKNLERNSIGYEISQEFIEIAQQKLNTRQPNFMEMEYNKTDSRKHAFSSKIEMENEAEREEFFIVKEILNPEKVRLSNGLTVKLIGIKGEPFTHDKAVCCLS